MTSHNASSPNRRAIFKGGAVLSLTGLSLISAGCSYNEAQASSEQTAQDINILNAAIGLEHEGIAAYQIAATSGLLSKAVIEVGVTFQGHHKEHRDVLIKAVEALGGSPAKEKSDADYIQSLNVASLKNQEDVLRLALKLEEGAANAYLGLIPSLGNDYHQVAAKMAGDEAYHAAILSNALGLPIPKAALIFG